MTFGYRDKFQTTREGEQPDGTTEGTSPALEEPTGNPDPDGIQQEPEEPEEHAAPQAPEFTAGGEQ